MQERTWIRMRQRMWARVKQATEALKGGGEEDSWIFRYYNDIPILLNEIDRVRRKVERNRMVGK